ncbi:sugar kinase [Echinicola pacifica]|uniref:Sugar kinase n=1 Tax=Echinicola pacifica TaxID=346377 RepID=A0A918UT89_9BACT|nr:ROK family protein [Echinicola pacifica]GGZ32283.1 sugar kinase [Echinicola pacifica]
MRLGIDLGGTKIHLGLEENGLITRQTRELLTEKDNLESTLSQIKSYIRPYLHERLSGIGIGVPSVVDTSKGVVYNVTNIPSWECVPLKAILESEFGLPVEVNNDVNCFVLGEYRYGKATPFTNVVGMSIGTGLGSGLILDGRLYIGQNCGAGEIGLLPYLDQNIEYYASGNFFPVTYNISALEAYQQACEGKASALAQWEEFGKHIGKAVLAVLYAYDPQAIVFGGSISKAFPYFRESMLFHMQEFIYPESLKKLQLLISDDELMPILGAAALIETP